jgi:hypothetical protein
VALLRVGGPGADVDEFVRFATDALGSLVRIQPAQVLALIVGANTITTWADRVGSR